MRGSVAACRWVASITRSIPMREPDCVATASSAWCRQRLEGSLGRRRRGARRCFVHRRSPGHTPPSMRPVHGSRDEGTRPDGRSTRTSKSGHVGSPDNPRCGDAASGAPVVATNGNGSFQMGLARICEQQLGVQIARALGDRFRSDAIDGVLCACHLHGPVQRALELLALPVHQQCLFPADGNGRAASASRRSGRITVTHSATAAINASASASTTSSSHCGTSASPKQTLDDQVRNGDDRDRQGDHVPRGVGCCRRGVGDPGDRMRSHTRPSTIHVPDWSAISTADHHAQRRSAVRTLGDGSDARPWRLAHPAAQADAPSRTWLTPGSSIASAEWSTVVGRSTTAISLLRRKHTDGLRHRLAVLVPVGVVVEHHADGVTAPPEDEERMTGVAEHLQLVARGSQREFEQWVWVANVGAEYEGEGPLADDPPASRPMYAPRPRRAARDRPRAAGVDVVGTPRCHDVRPRPSPKPTIAPLAGLAGRYERGRSSSIHRQLPVVRTSLPHRAAGAGMRVSCALASRPFVSVSSILSVECAVPGAEEQSFCAEFYCASNGLVDDVSGDLDKADRMWSNEASELRHRGAGREGDMRQIERELRRTAVAATPSPRVVGHRYTCDGPTAGTVDSRVSLPDVEEGSDERGSGLVLGSVDESIPRYRVCLSAGQRAGAAAGPACRAGRTRRSPPLERRGPGEGPRLGDGLDRSFVTPLDTDPNASNRSAVPRPFASRTRASTTSRTRSVFFGTAARRARSSSSSPRSGGRAPCARPSSGPPRRSGSTPIRTAAHTRQQHPCSPSLKTM